MQYCPKCRLNIRGEKAGCPLCGGRLAGDPEPGGFPVLEKRRFSHMSVVKVATFCCLSMFIILMAAEILCDFKLAWVPFVVLVLLIVWGDIMVGVYFRNNLIKTFTFETYLAMGACLLIDFLRGWRGWSLAFVLPIGFLMLVFETFIVGKAADLRLEEYIMYIVMAMLLSMLQIIPVLTHANPKPLPAVLCMTVLLILGFAEVIFRFRDLRSAAEKLFNL